MTVLATIAIDAAAFALGKVLSGSNTFCGTQVAQQYPRHRITLEDEADTVSARIVNRRLCAECWDALYPVLAETAPSHQ